MTTVEALAILEPYDDDPQEIWEEELFEIRRQILEKSHVPALLQKRKEKLLLYKEIGKVLQFQSDNFFSEIKLSAFEGNEISKNFALFQQNESGIKRALFSSLSIENQIYCADLFEVNLKQWQAILPKWEMAEKVLLGTKTDAMQLLHEIQYLAQRGIVHFSQLTKENCPKNLGQEISRLHAIFKKTEN